MNRQVKINAAEPPYSKKPIIDNQPLNNKWLFSFQDFNQIKNFGLNNVQPQWTASVFERLRDVCRISIDQFESNPVMQDAFRYHQIDWNEAPISRTDLDWIDKNIINNEQEFPFFQFHISKALGRIIGYWNENVFYIVFFDRMHNMQPSAYNNYKIRASTPVNTDLSNLLNEVETAKRINCKDSACNVKQHLMNISVTERDSNAVIFFLDDDYLAHLKTYSNQLSLTEILESGIAAIFLK